MVTGERAGELGREVTRLKEEVSKGAGGGGGGQAAAGEGGGERAALGGRVRAAGVGYQLMCSCQLAIHPPPMHSPHGIVCAAPALQP